MAKVSLWGGTYQDVPALVVPDGDGGTSTFYENGGGGTLIQKTITQNGTYSAEDDDADGYSSVTVNVPSSAASSWTKVAETEYQVSTTSTSEITVGDWDTGHSEIWTSDKFVYFRIRDTAGPRAGYFFGSDTFLANVIPVNGGSTSPTSSLIRFAKKVTAAGLFSAVTTAYGVFVSSVYNNGRIRIRARYNSSSSLTIDGTFKVEVYLLDPADGVPIFA